MDGQAESAPESGGLDDLASFLSDTPEEESTEEIEANPADDSTAESDTEEEASDEQEDEAEESEEEPAPVDTKITFKVKGEDGTEETVEASTEEIAASYLRQKDYTKKTQALAERESQAVNFLKTKHDEIRNQYLSQAELTRAALVQMAGLKSGDEMAQLAHSDPAAWVAENQRQQSVNAYLNQLDHQINGEKQRAAQEAEAHRAQSLQQQFQKTWEVLQKEKIDKPQLAKIYDGVSKSYGFTPEELGNVYDHRLVRMMRDAQAYQALKSQKADVTRKVADAPRMPQRQTAPSQERKQQTLERKFTNGTAKLKDLVAFLT
jgi:hypothetical protein